MTSRKVPSPVCLVVACLTILALPAARAEPSLAVGSKAPAIDIEHWIQTRGGRTKPFKEFAPGNVYVVEFWATWCGPCIASMPHLAETQNAYADKGVTIVSVSDEDVETIEKFLDTKTDDDKTYRELTKAWCLTTDPDGSVNKAYMEASEEGGIPTAFIVGKTGEIEWIGHPMQMDEPLEKIVSGSWNRAEYAEQKRQQDALQAKLAELGELLRGDDPQQAVAFVDRLIADTPGPALKTQLEGLRKQVEQMAQSMGFMKAVRAGGDGVSKTFAEMVASAGESVDRLNEVAWLAVQVGQIPDVTVPPEVLAAAAAAAEKAVGIDPENANALDTLAHLRAAQGDLDEAIAAQRKAVEHAKGRARRPIAAYLEELEAQKESRKK